jgi:DNA mismatch repair ATPase MutS
MSNVAAHETPMMRQYLEVKASQPGCLLLMRMGDFFEAFLEDAVEFSRITGVALTSRNKDADQPIAMAGVPHHSLPGYLPKLLAAGKRVAIMDQLEDPKEAKGLVKRGLTRVITAGTLIDESGIDASSANWLVAVTGFDGLVGIAALDVSTGRFTVEEADASRLALSLARLQPAELVVPDELKQADDPRAAARRAVCSSRAAAQQRASVRLEGGRCPPLSQRATARRRPGRLRHRFRRGPSRRGRSSGAALCRQFDQPRQRYGATQRPRPYPHHYQRCIRPST